MKDILLKIFKNIKETTQRNVLVSFNRVGDGLRAESSGFWGQQFWSSKPYTVTAASKSRFHFLCFRNSRNKQTSSKQGPILDFPFFLDKHIQYLHELLILPPLVQPVHPLLIHLPVFPLFYCWFISFFRLRKYQADQFIVHSTII